MTTEELAEFNKSEFKQKLGKFALFWEQEYSKYSTEEKFAYNRNMTNEEIELLNEHTKKYSEKMWEEFHFFWDNEYPKLNFKDKVNVWIGILRTSIRENIGDTYSGFNPEWHKEVLKKEPNIDKIISAAFDKHLNGYADKKEFFRRIKGTEKSTNIFIDFVSCFLKKILQLFAQKPTFKNTKPKAEPSDCGDSLMLVVPTSIVESHNYCLYFLIHSALISKNLSSRIRNIFHLYFCVMPCRISIIA